MTRARWVLVAPDRACEALHPLSAARARTHEVVVHRRTGCPAPEEWPALLGDGPVDGVLLVGDRRRAPATVLDSPFLTTASGAVVPAGWLPDHAGLATFARTAVRCAARTAPAPVALLGQRSARYQHLGGRLAHHLGTRPAVRWGAERVTREDLVAGLASGLGLAVYLGHGRPSGWAAYRGLRASHLEPLADDPVGLLASVTCWTASRRRVGLSFAEEVVLQGSAAAAWGAVRPTLHLDNTRLVLSLAEALRAGVRTAGELLSAVLVRDGALLPLAASYRLCGDPLVPLAGSRGATRRAYAVPAPAPDHDPRLARAGDPVTPVPEVTAS